MKMTCIQCEELFIRDDSIPFAPRICEICRTAREIQVEEQKERERNSAQKSITSMQLAIARSKIPSPNKVDTFNPNAWAVAKAWAYRASKPKPILIMAAPSGSQKTRMAVEALIMDLKEKEGRTFDWWTGMELKAAALAAYRGEAQSLKSFREQLARTRFLVLDELLSHAKISESLGELMLSVINDRVTHHRSTIITLQTSHRIPSLEKLVELVISRFDVSLTGEGIARRLYESSEYILL